MPQSFLVARGVVFALLLTHVAVAASAAPQTAIPLTVAAGRPLQIALDARTRVRRRGQAVTGHVIAPVFAYDRIVVPAGTLAHGHVEELLPPSRLTRLRAIWSGDFSPHRRVLLTFDSISLPDGTDRPIVTSVHGGTARTMRSVAASADDPASARASGGIRQWPRHAVAAAKGRLHQLLDTARAPGKVSRLRAAAIAQLPYHPQYLEKGTSYTANLTAPLAFGEASPTAAADPGTPPIPGSLLAARLALPINSRVSARGTPIDAVVTEPVFSSDRRLLYPEGTRLIGEVTFAKRARRFHRNGQLRFLIEHVQPPDRPPAPILASLHAVQTSAADHVTVDEEGGASVANTKARFVAPALAILAFRRVTDHDHHDSDGDPADVPGASTSGHGGGRTIGSFIGFRVGGAVLGRLWSPLGTAFTVVGVVRTMYTNVLARGRDVDFPADTPIQLQLAPARRSRQN